MPRKESIDNQENPPQAFSSGEDIEMEVFSQLDKVDDTIPSLTSSQGLTTDRDNSVGRKETTVRLGWAVGD